MEVVEIIVKGLPSVYETEHLARVFYPGAPLRTGPSTRGAVVYARVGKRRLVAALRTAAGTEIACVPLPADDQPAKRALSALLYKLLHRATGIRPPWGMLTGVRPVRLLRNTLQTGGEQAARRLLREGYDVSEEKYLLAHEIVQRQAPLLAKGGDDAFSLYVSIPFCPTRCAYCSFVSRTTAQDAKRIEPYLQKLEEEMRATAAVAKEAGLRLSTIYIGGGTPTALSAEQLKTLLRSVAAHFDTAAAAEYTVEAGRPDCTDFEKLALLKNFGVTRISINPQTLQDDVLRRIGRCHTAADILRCYSDARKAGHTSINMDLIAGLPGDDEAGFAHSLSGVIALAPENITVHTLTLKRASTLVVDERQNEVSGPAAMVEGATGPLRAAGYAPYYLYRQKSTLQNLENTGWALPGQEGLYNVHIMEETETILAVGAGAGTKLVRGRGQTIQRVFNPKFPADYLAQFPEILHNKRGVTQFYASNLDSETPR